MRLLQHSNFDFIRVQKWAWALTAVILIPGLIMAIAFPPPSSVEFTGGTSIQVRAATLADFGKVRDALSANGLHGAELQQYGLPTEFMIRARAAVTGSDADNTTATIAATRAALDQALGAGTYTIVHTYAVGPKVGAELRTQAFYLILLSFLAVLAYLAWRFEWRFGVAAVLATGHDILATVGFIAIMRMEVSLVVVAAVLSMVGYSLNDTIIIFDRVRENLHKFKRSDLYGVLNRSVNETLPRSILTHGTTLSTLGALAIFGGDVIRPFAQVMFFGVFTGTFSSIFIAPPVLLYIEKRWPGEDVKGTRSIATEPAR
ncbi:MAG TPA: protein translocase subunit SecF [Gemmatimonadales bacterium]|nr:protein translocase subunit SecF [Gemmatimonadales bacterium]